MWEVWIFVTAQCDPASFCAFGMDLCHAESAVDECQPLGDGESGAGCVEFVEALNDSAGDEPRRSGGRPRADDVVEIILLDIDGEETQGWRGFVGGEFSFDEFFCFLVEDAFFFPAEFLVVHFVSGLYWENCGVEVGCVFFPCFGEAFLDKSFKVFGVSFFC